MPKGTAEEMLHWALMASPSLTQMDLPTFPFFHQAKMSNTPCSTKHWTILDADKVITELSITSASAVYRLNTTKHEKE